MSIHELLGDVTELLNEEETVLAKSQPDDDDAADDDKIHAAASGDADDDGEPDSEDSVDDYDDDDEPEDDDKPLKKSFQVTLEDGTEADAYDGEALIKSFQDQVTAVREELTQVVEALGRSVKLTKALRAQNAELAESVRVLSKSGRGRQSVLNVHERPIVGDEMAKSEPASPSTLLSKALSAQRAGKMSGMEVAEIDAALASRRPVRADLLARLDA